MRISDWSSDVCSSDLAFGIGGTLARPQDVEHPADDRLRIGAVEPGRIHHGTDLDASAALRTGIEDFGNSLVERIEEGRAVSGHRVIRLPRPSCFDRLSMRSL